MSVLSVEVIMCERSQEKDVKYIKSFLASQFLCETLKFVMSSRLFGGSIYVLVLDIFLNLPI